MLQLSVEMVFLVILVNGKSQEVEQLQGKSSPRFLLLFCKNENINVLTPVKVSEVEMKFKRNQERATYIIFNQYFNNESLD